MSKLNHLTIDILKKSKLPIKSLKDIRILKAEIEDISGQKIGFNTLRRIYGFMDYASPSVKTLNTLSKYLGFKSYGNYLDTSNDYESWYFQQNLLRLKLKSCVEITDIEEINLGLLNQENVPYFAYFISHLILCNDIKSLDLIFKHCQLCDVNDSEIHKFSSIISTTLLGLKEKNAIGIYSELLHTQNFRDSVPFLFIDYANLTSRYLKILELINKKSDRPSDLFFVSLMKFHLYFYTEKTSDIAKYELQVPKGFDSFYPVLVGRYYGYLVLRSFKLGKTLKQQIIALCKRSKNISMVMEEIIPALIIKNEISFLDHISTKYYEEILESDKWSSPTTNAIFIIGLACVQIDKNDFKAATINLNLIDLKKIELGYEIYISLFYFLTSLKISFHKKLKAQNRLEFSQIKRLVKISKFTKFSKEADKFRLR